MSSAHFLRGLDLLTRSSGADYTQVTLWESTHQGGGTSAPVGLRLPFLLHVYYKIVIAYNDEPYHQ